MIHLIERQFLKINYILKDLNLHMNVFSTVINLALLFQVWDNNIYRITDNNII